MSRYHKMVYRIFREVLIVLEILSKILLYFLASYGVLVLFMTIIDSIRQRAYEENSKVRVALLVQNQEETIEGIIRNIYISDMLRKVMSNNKIAIVDMGSKDKTVEILSKLKNDYQFFDILDINKKYKIFEEFR
jgi:hypothetical protein